jgi:hypothetical protein
MGHGGQQYVTYRARKMVSQEGTVSGAVSSAISKKWKLVRVVTLTRNTQEDEKVRLTRNKKEIETRVYLRQAKGYLRTKG